jgi:hypothetical protein
MSRALPNELFQNSQLSTRTWPKFALGLRQEMLKNSKHNILQVGHGISFRAARGVNVGVEKRGDKFIVARLNDNLDCFQKFKGLGGKGRYRDRDRPALLQPLFEVPNLLCEPLKNIRILLPGCAAVCSRHHLR